MHEKSKCCGGWLHRYEIVKLFDKGVVEECGICRKRKFFSNNMPSSKYLDYHNRSALQKINPRFKKEYESTTATTN